MYIYIYKLYYIACRVEMLFITLDEESSWLPKPRIMSLRVWLSEPEVAGGFQ